MVFLKNRYDIYIMEWTKFYVVHINFIFTKFIYHIIYVNNTFFIT